MFTIRHGKDLADCMGSMIVRWLREKEATVDGLKPNLGAIISHLKTCINEHNKHGTKKADVVVLPWKPTTERPCEIVQLRMGNIMKSNSKTARRNDEGEIVVIEKGLPDTTHQGSPQIETGEPITLKIRTIKRRARVRGKRKQRKVMEFLFHLILWP